MVAKIYTCMVVMIYFRVQNINSKGGRVQTPLTTPPPPTEDPKVIETTKSFLRNTEHQYIMIIKLQWTVPYLGEAVSSMAGVYQTNQNKRRSANNWLNGGNNKHTGHQTNRHYLHTQHIKHHSTGIYTISWLQLCCFRPHFCTLFRLNLAKQAQGTMRWN